MSRGISIGIPLLSADEESLEHEIQRALALRPGEIIISINAPELPPPDLQALRLDYNRVPVLIFRQPRNLGLYGNFRFLQSSAASPFFMWLCQDDVPTSDLDRLEEALTRDDSLALAVPTQELWEWERAQGHTAFLGRIIPPPPSSSGRFPLPDPSWIFGLWRTAALRCAMPSTDFDWLDFAMVMTLLVEDRVVGVDTSPAAVIGHRSGLPHHAIARRHNPTEATIRLLRQSLRSRHSARDRLLLFRAVGTIWHSALIENRRLRST